MYKSCNVVMLSSNEKASISINKNGKMFINSFSDTTNYNLYITSNDEIKEGDWYFNTGMRTREYGVIQADKRLADLATNAPSYKKIIVSTDGSLVYNRKQLFENNLLNKDEQSFYKQLPQLSTSFIEHFVSEYNLGNVIAEVMVEFERFKERHGDGRQFFMSNRLKINQDNTCNIKTVKDSWSRKEVEELIYSAMKDIRYTTVAEFKEWVNQNL